MCGIVGFINKEGKSKENTKDIKGMIDIQRHRGPDDNGIYGIYSDRFMKYNTSTVENVEEGVKGFFGFSRLSILDLSSAGHQPMKSANGRVLIVFNGEVYNAFDYKDELEKKGYLFNSGTDTEVILNLYLEYGFRETVSKLNGMFAIAIYDLDKKKLFLARDRIGIKPLYIYKNNDIFAFASEIKSFLNHRDIKIELDVLGMQECFVFGSNYKRTLIKDVVPVQPGEILELGEDNVVKYDRFFELDHYIRPNKTNETLESIKKKTEIVLKKCVQRQMISDVKLGCQLSGGIDSSLISYIASTLGDNHLNDSVAVVFDQQHQEYSEEKYIDFVSEQLNLDLHKCTLDEEYYLKNLQRSIWHLDTIPAYYNELGILLLSEEARKHVTVLLSGEGADELLAGYTRIAYSSLVKKVSHVHMILPSKVKRKIWKGRQCGVDNYIVFKEAVPLDICQRVIEGYNDETVSSDRIDIIEKMQGDYFDKQIKYEMSVRLQGLLNRQDKTTMANSIENRVPFLDNEMVDWSFTIPKKYLIHNRGKDWIKKIGGTHIQGKYVLKEICKEQFGENFAYRDKGGFGIPCRDYLKNKKMKKFCTESIIPKMKSRGVLNAEIVGQWYENIEMITPEEENALWRALTLEMWAELFIDRAPMELEKEW